MGKLRPLKFRTLAVVFGVNHEARAGLWREMRIESVDELQLIFLNQVVGETYIRKLQNPWLIKGPNTILTSTELCRHKFAEKEHYKKLLPKHVCSQPDYQ